MIIPVLWKVFSKAVYIHQCLQKAGLHGDGNSKLKFLCPFAKSTPRKSVSCSNIRREDSSLVSNAIASIASFPWLFMTETAKPEFDKLIKSILDLNKAATVVTTKDILEADTLFNNYTDNDYQRILYLLLKHYKSDIADISWRLARLYHKRSENEKNIDFKTLLLKEAINMSDMAMEINPNCSEAYLWKAISLYDFSKMNGLMEYTKQLIAVKELLKRAKELKPDDPLAHHLFGMLYEMHKYRYLELAFICINVVELPRIVTVVTEWFYGPLPKCTHEEALESFLLEEKSRAIPTCMNYYMLIKLFVHFQNYLESRDYLVKLEDLLVQSEEDLFAKEMSQEFLKLVAKEVTLQLDEQSLYWHSPGPSEEEMEDILEAAETNESFIPRLVRVIDVIDRMFSQDEDAEEKLIPDWEEDPLAWSKLKNWDRLP